MQKIKIGIKVKKEAQESSEITQITQPVKVSESIQSILIPVEVSDSSQSIEDYPSDIVSDSDIVSSQEDIKQHIKQYFLEPLKELINNEGVSNGYLIANVDALKIMKKIIKSILKQKKISIIDILEKAALADYFPESEESLEESPEEVEQPIPTPPKQKIKSKPRLEKYFNNEDNYDEEQDLDIEEVSDEPEEDDEDYDIEAARECDSYNYEEDESMDG